MAKTILSLIIIIHGLIHLLGFFKAFGYGNINQLSAEFSRPTGIVWLAVALLFLTTVILYLRSYSYWSLLAIVAVIASQILIFMVWEAAKFGTIANVVIIIAILPSLGNLQFSNMVENEQQELLEHVSQPSGRVITADDLDQLPDIVQKWLTTSGVVDKPDIFFIRLKQSGNMQTEPEGKRMNFAAIQYFDVKNPAFIWSVDVEMMPLVYLTGRDKLRNGEGEMLIKLLSLVNVVNDGHHEKMNAATLIRFLGEICWFPAAALNDYIQWEEINSLAAKATMTINDQRVTGVFRFRENGEMSSFEAKRNYGDGEHATMETWVVEAVDQKTFDGYRIPNKIEVTWKLPDGDFTWLNLEITELQVNNFALYE